MPEKKSGLIPLPAGGYDDEYARRLFGSFREVFCAERLPERAIFWVEEKFGKLVVRHVQDQKKRQRKGDDQLITRTINDLAAARVMIGNFAAGCKLSTVRWELYGDFELSTLPDQGRFDFRDLAGDVDQAHAQGLVAQGIRPIGDWDFDSIILMHQCPLCRGCFDSSAILYTSKIPCETCDKVISLGSSASIIKELIRGYQCRLGRITTDDTVLENGEFPVQHFIDPIPNTVMYWILDHFRAATRETWEQLLGENRERLMKDMYSHSLFNLMQAKYMQNVFADYLRRLGKPVLDIDYDLGVLRRVGKTLSTPALIRARQQNTTEKEEFADNYDITYAQELLPQMIDDIIVGHAAYYSQPQPRKELPHVHD